MLKRKKKGKRERFFQVAVTIIEAKHLAQNVNPMVVVKVGNKRKRTIVREHTDNPYYNEYFVFNISGDFNELLSTKIAILVYVQNCLRRKFYGAVCLEVASVWEEPGHEFYHKWAILTNPKDRGGGTRGFIKCDISVNVKGGKIEAHPDVQDVNADDIERNLLMPALNYPISGRKKARYIFTIYRADGLPHGNTNSCYGNSRKPINPFIQITFAGMKGETNYYKSAYHVRYNEKIIFTEMFPPLSIRVKISIKNKIDSCSSPTVATQIINFADLLNYCRDGYLPTFGPSFLHFYRDHNLDSKWCCIIECPTIQPIYCGRALLSLKTEIDDSGTPNVARVDIEPSAPIIEKYLWTTEEYLLVGIIYDVYMIDRCKFITKPISFEMTFGNVGSDTFLNNIENSFSQTDEVALDNRLDFQSNTAPRLTATTDGKFNYLPFGSNKPCIYIKSWWPNFQWRISNSNCLLFIANSLENSLIKLETLIAVKSGVAYENYNSTIESLKQHCIRYLHLLDGEGYNVEGGTTKLDRLRINFCRCTIEKILKMIKSNGPLTDNNLIKIAINQAYKCLKKIRKIQEDPQHTFPDIFIWMIAGSRRVALARLPASEIIYSEMNMSRGIKCGQRVNLFFESIGYNERPSDYVVCTIELFLWLGNVKFSSACWSLIPGGYDVEHFINVETFPRSFNYTQILKFQLRAHIFQGRFNCGLDSTGLMDPFIRIIFRGFTATTKTIKKSLAPIWDQTLVFPPIKLYGTKEYIKSFPPQVIIEAFDSDSCGMKEFYGRCIANPVVKLMEDDYSPPGFPPILKWYTFESESNLDGSVSAAFELIEVSDEIIDHSPISLNQQPIHNMPDDIRPVMKSHRLEIVFWGVRDMKKINGIRINRPRVVIECCGIHVKSEIMKSVKKFSNFRENHIIVNLDLPQEFIYYPPLTIKAYDCRYFGCFTYIGVCIVPSCHIFLRELLTEEEYSRKMNTECEGQEIYDTIQEKRFRSVSFSSPTARGIADTEKKHFNSKKSNGMSKMLSFGKILRSNSQNDNKNKSNLYGDDENESTDWWYKYYASLQMKKNRETEEEKILLPGRRKIATIKIYQSELELQPEFHKFQDKLTTFELSRGKVSGDFDYYANNFMGKLKGHIAIYSWPHPTKSQCKTKCGNDASYGLLADYPPQQFVKLLVRLYVIKGINLHPCDPISGRSDPYLIVKCGGKTINDKKNYIPNQTNPIFGRSFEMDAYFPQDHTLVIQVWDHDTTSADDMIGETKIDIESRYYSDHRGQCGISETYSTSGYNAWRDFERPTQILQYLCIKNNLPLPEFLSSAVAIGNHKFPFYPEIEMKNRSEYEECMALNVLHQWQNFPVCGVALVPEHIERRSLFNMKKSGLEQGKLELWVDMFRVDELPPKPLVDITPQVPEDYELRIIVWNTEGVPLIDNQFLSGEKCSDIYIISWMLYEDWQRTDTHYNSLNGEGNFNWRFIFRFTYSKAERLMTIHKKLSKFSIETTEQKLPCKIHVQIWDGDHFSPDDFLGSLTMELSRMPRGCTNAKKCTLKVIHPNSPTLNLFKAKHIKAWWPFTRATSSGEYLPAGKVEMELTLLPIAEAEKSPAGKGREPPNPLPFPIRPDTSFSWFRNPWKACCFVVCRYYRTRIVCFCFILLFMLLLGCAIYAFPGYLVKKLLGA